MVGQDNFAVGTLHTILKCSAGMCISVLHNVNFPLMSLRCAIISNICYLSRAVEIPSRNLGAIVVSSKIYL